MAAIIVLTLRLITKKWSAGLLIGYVLIILGETVLFRTSTVREYFQPQLFWSYEEWDLQKEQIIANVLLFIPLGLILGKLLKWKGPILGMGISVVVEVLQLITYRGLFEFDDIVHNTLGTLIGVAICITFEKVIKKENIERGNR